MPRPGTTISRSDTRPARSARTGTGPWFVAGITGTVDTLGAPGVRQSVKSLTDYATRFGTRAQHVTATDPTLYDEIEFYFKEGGSEVFVSRTADAVDATLTAALALFTKDLGPGQVSAPGRNAAAQHVIVDAHAEAKNRIAINDGPNTATVSTLTALATPSGVTQAQERVSSVWTPYLVVPGLTPGTTRTIPPSGVVAAIMSRNDGAGISQNQASAGVLGNSISSLDVAQTFIEADRTTLNANGINLLRVIDGVVTIYGYRTLADPTNDDKYVNLANSRLLMAIQAECDSVAGRFVFRQIDAQRLTISEYGGALTGVLLPYWQRGSLYGVTPQDAFSVDTGPNVNTDATIANGELHAIIGLKMSPYAEEVFLELVKTRITETI